MFSSVKSVALSGINGIITSVEADIRNGLPSFNMVGFLSTQVRESGERVRAAVLNSGFYLEPKRILVNLSPADIKKDGTSFDLAVAVAILAAQLSLDNDYLLEAAFVGELSLSGELKSVTGVLPMVSAAREAGIRRFVLPVANYREAKLVDGIEIIGVASLLEAIEVVQKRVEKGRAIDIEPGISDDKKLPDFSEVHGQEGIKRAVEIAVSGMHNILMIGQAGSGKSMLASRIPSIMPPMSVDESLEVTKIYSISGLLEEGRGLIETRPFRSPHNSISLPALVGGGSKVRAGEISLAHNGVLFLDELPEFNRQTIEVLRQPLEEKKITIGRISGTATYPADFLLAAAMNPCKCGFYPDRKFCRCNEVQIKNYLSRVSRPLIDRFDIVAEVKRISFDSIFNKEEKSGENSDEIRKRVLVARDIQEERFKHESIHFNSQMDSKMTDEFCKIDQKTKALLEEAYKNINLSLRGYYRVLKVARTIADMRQKDEVGEFEVAEAIHYREMIERFWG